MLDTSLEALRTQIAIIRSQSASERLHQALELSDTLRALALTRLRVALPELSERQLLGRLLQQETGSREVLLPFR